MNHLFIHLTIIMIVLNLPTYGLVKVSPYNLIDTDNPGTAIHIRWKSTTPGTIHYGINDFSMSKDGDENGVHITDLIPGARYKYIVVSGDTSVEGSFRTSPPCGVPFSIALCSDTQEADSTVTTYLDAIYEHSRPDLLVIVGDIVTSNHNNGSVFCFSAKCSYDSLINHSKKLFANTIMVPVQGNHDSSTQFNRPGNSYTKFFSVLPDSGREYLFKYGSASFLMALDSTGKYNKELLNRFRALDARYKLAFVHKPPNSAGYLPNAWYFQNEGAQVIYSGHIHISYLSAWTRVTYDSIRSTYPSVTTPTQTDGYFRYCQPGCPDNREFSIALVDSIENGLFKQDKYRIAQNGSIIDGSGGSFTIVSDTTTAIELATPRKNIEKLLLEYAPNPTNGLINLRHFSTSKGLISIFDISGRQLESIATDALTSSRTIQINCSRYPIGNYYIYFKNGNKKAGYPLTILR